MPKVISDTSSLVHELSEARVIQAVLVIMMTITLMVLYIMQLPIPSELSSIWLFSVGLYMELPSKPRKPPNQ